MKKHIQVRLASLRKEMVDRNIDAFVIPSTDPHLSEYVAPHWGVREWISGFTGSAGTIVVTTNKAGLWTDSRYFLQGAEQLAGTGIDLYKEALPETPTITVFLLEELHKGCRVGINGEVFATTIAQQMEGLLNKNEIEVVVDFDPFSTIWQDRPSIPTMAPYVYQEKYAGKSCKEKLGEIREKLLQKGREALFISALDEIAWTLNLRGSDVKYNPVFIGYLYINQSSATLFIAPEKVTAEVAEYLARQGVGIAGYGEVTEHLRDSEAATLLLNPAQTNYRIYSAINLRTKIVCDSSPASILKAIRNPQEIEGLRHAMKKDGIALVRFLMWLEKSLPNGSETELSIDKKLHELRAEQPFYVGESFGTIAGYAEHGAIVHYAATPESNATLLPKGFLLLDSGAQYLDGTTDITRTIALGELTEEEKTDYTLVLKGHIALSMAVFPAGTRGVQLDVLARMPMWKHRMNFLHGTGHGVGHFLNVHEGPQSIRMNENPVMLQAGMLTSNEPGIYKAGKHGVRTENLMLAIHDGEGMFGGYLKFETMTLCPICTKGIVKEMLANEEIAWLNEYHQKVYRELSPALSKEEQAWLKEATKAI